MKYLALLSIAVTASLAGPVERSGIIGNITGAVGDLFPGTRPQVSLDYANYKGIKNAGTGTNDFLGMRFATAKRLGVYSKAHRKEVDRLY